MNRRRLPSESHKQYRENLKKEARQLRLFKQGRLIWLSKQCELVPQPNAMPKVMCYDGRTYVREAHGHIGTQP